MGTPGVPASKGLEVAPAKILKNYMKMKEFWIKEGCAPDVVSLDPSLEFYALFTSKTLNGSVMRLFPSDSKEPMTQLTCHKNSPECQVS